MATTLQSVPAQPGDHAAVVESAALDALLHGAGVAPLNDVGWIRVTGDDRVRWLNGMVTNSIQDLKPGEGCYSFVLNAQGRIQGDITAFLLEDSILLETSRDQLPALLAHLDHFIIMDDVELAAFPNEPLPVSKQNPDRAGLVVAGPQAAAMLQRIGISTAPSSTLTLRLIAWKRDPIDLIHAHSPLVPRFEIWSDLTTILEIKQAVTPIGAVTVTSESLEQLRILEGTPRYGVDIRNSETARDLPQETAPIGVQHRALHFTKGCYLGQEIVERIRSRGNVHRTFSGFELTGTLPAPGTALTAEGKTVGELTSVAQIPLAASESESKAASTAALQLALGYIRREALADAQARRIPLQYSGGIAKPVGLPYAFS
jgi:folate-binding protein YgfZ